MWTGFSVWPILMKCLHRLCWFNLWQIQLISGSFRVTLDGWPGRVTGHPEAEASSSVTWTFILLIFRPPHLLIQTCHLSTLRLFLLFSGFYCSHSETFVYKVYQCYIGYYHFQSVKHITWLEIVDQWFVFKDNSHFVNAGYIQLPTLIPSLVCQIFHWFILYLHSSHLIHHKNIEIFQFTQMPKSDGVSVHNNNRSIFIIIKPLCYQAICQIRVIHQYFLYCYFLGRNL